MFWRAFPMRIMVLPTITVAFASYFQTFFPKMSANVNIEGQYATAGLYNKVYIAFKPLHKV